MPTKALTADFVAKAKAPEGKDREFWWDEGLPGFGLMVTANGAKSYVVQYRSRWHLAAHDDQWRQGAGGRTA